MYTECREYLIKKLAGAGIKRTIHITQKTLDDDEESHKAAVISETDELTRGGQKITYKDEKGEKHKRVKKFDRKITYIVTIGDHTAQDCEAIFDRFLKSLDPGIYIDGNFTEIELATANWYDEEDKIIKAKAAVVMKITFTGGLYVDTDFKRITFDVFGAEMERSCNGS